MRVGENPGKIGNIVSAQYERFQTLYAPFFTSSSFSSVLSRTGDDISLDTSPRARGLLARKLPLGVKDKVRAMYAEKSEGMTETDEVAMWTRLAKDESFKGNLAKSASTPRRNDATADIVQVWKRSSLDRRSINRLRASSRSDRQRDCATLDPSSGRSGSRADCRLALADR